MYVGYYTIKKKIKNTLIDLQLVYPIFPLGSPKFFKMYLVFHSSRRNAHVHTASSCTVNLVTILQDLNFLLTCFAEKPRPKYGIEHYLWQKGGHCKSEIACIQIMLYVLGQVSLPPSIYNTIQVSTIQYNTIQHKYPHWVSTFSVRTQ